MHGMRPVRRAAFPAAGTTTGMASMQGKRATGTLAAGRLRGPNEAAGVRSGQFTPYFPKRAPGLRTARLPWSVALFGACRLCRRFRAVRRLRGPEIEDV